MNEKAKTKKVSKKTIALIGLALLLVISATMATLAWLTAHDVKENTFTVGDFKDPVIPTDPTDPDNPDPGNPDPDKPGDLDKDKLTGHIYEEKWVKDSKLLPDNDIAKDPKIGMGPGSEDSCVYVYVKNNLVGSNQSHIYFTLNTANWEPVADCVQKVNVGNSTYYSGGMFKYKGDDATNGILAGNKDYNVWTPTVFDKVHVSDTATAETLKPAGTDAGGPKVTVECFLHQVRDGQGSAIDVDSVILPAAKEKFGLAVPTN